MHVVGRIDYCFNKGHFFCIALNVYIPMLAWFRTNPNSELFVVKFREMIEKLNRAIRLRCSGLCNLDRTNLIVKHDVVQLQRFLNSGQRTELMDVK
jgi:hypothetical protein